MRIFIFCLLSVVWFAGNSVPSSAGPFVNEHCMDSRNRNVPQEVRSNVRDAASIQRDGSGFKIVLNPRIAGEYLSRETWRWLFLRQCAFIRLDPENAPRTSQDSAKSDWANCAALRMLKDRKSSPHARSIIERDFEKLSSEDRRKLINSSNLLDLKRCR